MEYSLADLPEHIAKRIRVSMGHWIWQKAPDGSGYGRTYSRRLKRKVQVHREVWELLVGDIPDGFELDHGCRILLCCKPACMEIVTPKENIARSSGLGAIYGQRTHCPQGHEYNAENTSWIGGTSKGAGYRRRNCRKCKNQRAKEARERKRVTA